jgi:hypothetical protein
VSDTSFLAELPENEATGRIREIYAEIKLLGGVPMVALIFRHLATLPGGIEWMWEAIGPAWRSGRLQEASWRIARETPLRPIAAIPRPALAALGMDATDLREVRTVLEAYNRANPENMLSVLCLLRMIEGRRAVVAPVTSAWAPPPAPGPLVPMASLATLRRDLSELLDLVAAPGDGEGPRVVQSLYRHLAHRPAFLALAVTLLRQRFDDGSIAREVGTLGKSMADAADQLVRELSAPPAPHPGVLEACRRFGGAVIPQMIVVGALLERALPGN